MVRNPNDGNPAPSKDCIPGRVQLPLLPGEMDWAIEFDVELEFGTIEVGYQTVQHLLTTELEAEASAVPEQFPGSSLSWRRHGTELLGTDPLPSAHRQTVPEWKSGT